jgi:hypothetical protein
MNGAIIGGATKSRVIFSCWQGVARRNPAGNAVQRE